MVYNGGIEMHNLLVKLRNYQSSASPTEKSIIDYILHAPVEVSNMSIHALAEKTFASPTSIIRLCKKIGCDGFKAFTKTLIYEQAIRDSFLEPQTKQLAELNATQDVIQSVIINNIQILHSLSTLMSEMLIDECVKCISVADKIVFFGLGASLIVAKDAQMKFIRVNKMVHLSDDWHTQLLMARNMSQKDVAFVISYSGETEEVIQCTSEAKMMGATIISITKAADSTISQLADISLFVPDSEVGLRSAAMSSRIAQMTVIDVVFSRYLQSIYEEGLVMIERTRIKKRSDKND